MEHIQYLVYSKVATPEHSTLETLTCATYSTPEAVIRAVAECATNETITAIYELEYKPTRPDGHSRLKMSPRSIEFRDGRLQLC